MAKIPIDECPAGSAMDAAVARALGWYHDPDWEDCAAFRSWWFDNVEFKGKPLCLPHFSTDIAAAWTPFEKLKNSEATLGWTKQWLVPYINLPVPELVTKGNLGRYGTMYGETHPEAISRAFLKANGIEYVEVPEE